MQMLAVGEQISVDFAVYNNRSFMVVKDRVSGLIWARPTKDQTTQEAFKVIMEWSYRMGLPIRFVQTEQVHRPVEGCRNKTCLHKSI